MKSPSKVKLGKRLESPAAGTRIRGLTQPPSPPPRVSSERSAVPGESPPLSEYASSCPVGDQSGLVPAGTGRLAPILVPVTASNSAIAFPTVATTRASSGEKVPKPLAVLIWVVISTPGGGDGRTS